MLMLLKKGKLDYISSSLTMPQLLRSNSVAVSTSHDFEDKATITAFCREKRGDPPAKKSNLKETFLFVFSLRKDFKNIESFTVFILRSTLCFCYLC